MGLLGGFRSVASFLTILPVGFSTIEEMASYAFLFPFVGGLIGLACGLIGMVLFEFLPSDVAGWVLLAALALITGLNHMDGLLDLGDALMVRGTREKKLEILHDMHHGIGGFALIFFTLVITQSLLVSLRSEIVFALVISETLAKLSMVIMGAVGNPSEAGLGSTFIKSIGRRRRRTLTLSVAIAAVILALALPSAFAAIPLLLSIFFSLVMTRLLQRDFGCITGDMLGSLGELTRALSLLALLFMV